MRLLAKLMVVLAAATAIVLCLAIKQNRLQAASETKTKFAPDFKLKDTSGKTVRLTTLKGKIVLLDFWATWCPPCRASLPHTQELSKSPEAKAGKLVVLAINVGESAKTVKDFMHKNGYTFRALLDEKGNLLDKYNSDGIPTFVIVDKKGKIAWKQVGLDEEALDAALKKALK